MKYKYIILILTIIISSCDLTGDLYISDWELPVKINSIQKALDYVDDNYSYQEKSGVFTPEEFYNEEYGDCEDHSVMLQFIFETKLDITSDLVGGYNPRGKWHMWVETEGIIYEAVRGEIVSSKEGYEELYRYDYIEATRMIEAHGGFIE